MAWHWKPAEEIFLGDFTDGEKREREKGRECLQKEPVFLYSAH